ncbi:MAG: hypothetical protein AB7O57_02885 [Hyphomicrobiaceae bacterium]
MKALLAVFVAGSLAGGFSVHQVYTSKAVSFVEAQGDVLYSDADRRALRSVIRSELLRVKRGKA